MGIPLQVVLLFVYMKVLKQEELKEAIRCYFGLLVRGMRWLPCCLSIKQGGISLLNKENQHIVVTPKS